MKGKLTEVVVTFKAISCCRSVMGLLERMLKPACDLKAAGPHPWYRPLSVFKCSPVTSIGFS
ncbi:hypothetical protein Avbf_18867 [Armadillidium vulgare]|nr:hypothetical protein Avbf_18867 [Armadillidium vulgare]